MTDKQLQGKLDALGKNLAEMRIKKGITQEELAFETNLDRTYISLVERGKRNPTFKRLCQFADVLQVSLSDLVKVVDE